jgi:hypothetical protein
MAYIVSPYTTFFDTDGAPLNNGYVYIGTANLNPVTSPIAVYWDEALTQPAAQPFRTLNGFFSRSGTPSRVYTAATDFSILVNDSKGEMVYSSDSIPPQVSQQDIDNGLATKLNLAGGTMTGPIVLPGNPTLNLQAAPKQYVDSSIAAGNFLSKTGGTMTGKLNLASVGVGFSDASTQTTAGVAKTGDTMSGLLTLSGDPTQPLQAATKQFVENWSPLETRVRAWGNFIGLPVSGTYTQSGNIITLNLSAFAGVSTGNLVSLTFSSGTAVSGTYTVGDLLSLTSFQVTSPTSASTSGNVTLNISMLDSYGCSSLADRGVGAYSVYLSSSAAFLSGGSGIATYRFQNASGTFVNNLTCIYRTSPSYIDIDSTIVTSSTAAANRDAEINFAVFF